MRGRLTSAQARALAGNWDIYRLPGGLEPLDFPTVFGRRAPVVLEVGFGNGDNLLHLASKSPDHDFIGAEIYSPGTGRLLHRLEQNPSPNIRIHNDDVRTLLERVVVGTLAKVLIFFPDPWPKRRHQRRRLVQPEFIALLANRMEPQGILHIATDSREYATWMRSVIATESSLRACALADSAEREISSPFELRFGRLGHQTQELVYRRIPYSDRVDWGAVV